MRKTLWSAAIVLLAGILVPLASPGTPISEAQGDSCAPLIAETIATVRATCANLSPETLCVGASPVEAIQASGGPVSPAPTWPLRGLSRITAGPLDPVNGSWGVGVLRVPGVGAGEQMTAILYGDATLINEPGPPIAPVCQAVSVGTVNIRAEPNTVSAILGQLNLNESAPIGARLRDSSWWQIIWDGEPAWVYAQLAPADCDPATMLVLNPVTGDISGGLPAPDFQSVRLESSFVAPACADGPRGGLLLQAEGESASWRVNGVSLGLSETVLLQAGANDVLAVHVLTGQVVLETSGVSRLGSAGQLLRVPLRDGILDSLPGLPLDLVATDAALAPVSLLPRPVTPPETTAPLARPTSAELACNALPQSLVVTSQTDTTAQIRVVADTGQTIRVSAQSAGGVTRLRMQVPGDQVAQPVAAAADDSGPPIPTGLRADVTTAAAGTYTFLADLATNAEVRFTVTCDLPAPTTPPPLQSCESILLRWEEVAGNNVRFSAPLGTMVSVTAEHGVPSQGPASTLEVLTAAGERIGHTAFVPFPDRQAAGPLDALLPQDGVYVIRWDGDPFNVADVEALCLVPPEPTVTPEGASP